MSSLETKGISTNRLRAVKDSKIQPKSKAPARYQTKTIRCWGRAVLYTVVLFFILTFFGCAIMNRYVFLPENKVPATSVKNSLIYQSIWFPASDGVQLNGWFVPGARQKPLVLFFHGNAGNITDNIGYLTLLHGYGFPLFIFDYRGYGKSNGTPLLENDLYQDARGAISYLERQGWQHEKIIFFGQSLGSAVALQMALEKPPAGLVMESSFTSMKEIVKYVSPLAYYTISWWAINLKFDNLAKVAQVRVPLLLIHGNEDMVVPIEMTRQLFARAGAPKSLHIISGGGHCNVFTRDSSAYLVAWSNYLQSISERITARSLSAGHAVSHE